MSTFILKSKLFFLDANGNVITGAEVLAQKQAAGGSAAGALKAVSKQKTAATQQAAAIRTETRALNKASHDSFAKMGAAGNKAGIQNLKATNAVKGTFNAGQKSVGVMGGMKNTWNRMGTMGKAGTVAAAGLTAGLALKGLMSGRKKDKE